MTQQASAAESARTIPAVKYVAGDTAYRNLVMAMLPAAAILLAAATVLDRLLG